MLVALLMSATIGGGSEAGRSPARFGDFGAYWVAARCVIEGRNSRDPSEVEMVARREGIHQTFVTWNPPWALLLLVPFALLPLELGALFWLATNILLVIGAAVLWGRRTGLRAFPSVVLGITFVPVAVCLGFSQLSILVLAGVVAYWTLSQAGRPFLSGLALFAATTKPHLVTLVWILVFFNGSFKSRAYTLLGLGSTLTASLAVLLIWRPESIGDYFQSLSHPSASAPTNFVSATPAAWLQWFMEVIYFHWSESHLRMHWIAYLPVLVVAPLMAMAAVRRPIDDRLFESALVLSILLLPYGWHYDQVLLLPAYLSLCGRAFRSRDVMNMSLLLAGMVAFELGSGGMLATRTPERYFVVWPVVFCLIWVWANWTERNKQECQARS